MTAWPKRLVDRLDDLLARLEGAHGGDHVDHRAGGVGAGALQRAGADGARGGAGGGAGDERVALLARVGERHDAEAARVDLAVGGGDRAAGGVEHRVALRGHEPALGVERELAVARVAHALRGLDGEEALAGDREVERLAGLARRAWG